MQTIHNSGDESLAVRIAVQHQCPGRRTCKMTRLTRLRDSALPSELLFSTLHEFCPSNVATPHLISVSAPRDI